MSFSIRWSVALLAGLLITACEKPQTPQPTGESGTGTSGKPVAMRPVQPASGELPSRQSYLRDVLPTSAYAYARIPSTWGVIGVPTGGALDRAVGSAPYVDAVRAIREGFGATVVPDLPQDVQFMTRFFLQHATSPIEAAALASPDPASPIPNVLLTTTMDFTSVEALNVFLSQAAMQYPAIQVLESVKATSAGMLSVVGVPTQVQWDAASSRLYMLSGTALQPASLADALKTLQSNPAHPMRSMEKTIDASGQGLFIWVNPPKLLELANATGQQEQVAMLALFGLTSMKSVGIGMGTSGGIHRLKTVVDMPQMGFRAFLPVIKDAPVFSAAGAPKAVAVLGLPSPDDLVSIEAAAATLNTPEDMRAYREFKKLFAEKAGISIEDILASLGQDVSFVSDEAGQYLAVRVKDAPKFQSLIDSSAQRFGLKYSQREIAGHTYHHLRVPSIDSLYVKEMDEERMQGAKLFKRFLDVPSHIYWVKEGDYLLMASLPQVLMDRNYITTRTPVDRWLQKQQRMDASGALLMASVRNEGLPAFMYRMNLEVLSYLGDVVERPVDMFALPTPREAGLPKEGAFGVKITSSDTQLAFELAFENNPVEFLLAGNGYTGVAVAGVLAAVAIPAYQDYTVRAQVTEGVNATQAVRQYLEEFARSNGRYPSAAEIEELDLSDFETSKYHVFISPDDGRVVVEFDHEALDEGNVLVFTPHVEDNALLWECESELETKYLPRECR